MIVIASAMIPGEEGAALRGDGQAGDVSGGQLGICGVKVLNGDYFMGSRGYSKE